MVHQQITYKEHYQSIRTGKNDTQYFEYDNFISILVVVMITKVINVSGYAEDNHHQAIQYYHIKQNEKVPVILDSNAIVKPYAMMIEMFSAPLTATAMFGKILNIGIAMVAEIVIICVIELLFCKFVVPLEFDGVITRI